MNVRNCRRCGKIFNYIVGQNICPSCREEMDKKFREVKDYIREHKGVGIHEVAEACEVDVSQIHQWLREERLELVEGSGIVLQCESCGAVITSGKYCGKCKRELTMGLKNAVEPKKTDKPAAPEKNTRDKGKMRYL